MLNWTWLPSETRLCYNQLNLIQRAAQPNQTQIAVDRLTVGVMKHISVVTTRTLQQRQHAGHAAESK